MQGWFADGAAGLYKRGRHAKANAPRPKADGKAMREIVRTNDAVLINAIEALFDGAHIAYMVLDQNMSVLEGSIGLLPRRIVVADDQEDDARKLLTDAGLAGELRERK